MKEHPIIMSGELVPKILDGSKTQTHRVMKPQPIFVNTSGGIYTYEWKGQYVSLKKGLVGLCPYGQVGDRLWVKETFAMRRDGVDQILYKSDYEEIVRILELHEFAKWRGLPFPDIKWKPSIHMFRKDSRINLDITNIRAELLLDISEADARAEGFNSIEEFLAYWDIKFKKQGYGRDKNPWLWPIEFKLLKGG